MDWTTFQDELRHQLKDHRGSCAKVARRLHVRPSAVSRYVSGGHPVPADHVNTILTVLGLELIAVPRLKP